MDRARVLAIVSCVGFSPTLFGQAQAQLASTYSALLSPLLSTEETILGQPITYPTGTPLITSAIITLPPGGQTGWHEHSIPLYAYILEGELTVDYGPEGTRVYRAGEAVMEAIDWAHNGTSTGTVPVRILAVYIGAEAVPTAEVVPAPAR
jgi:quercetin dioxygenase-like cupin family protein